MIELLLLASSLPFVLSLQLYLHVLLVYIGGEHVAKAITENTLFYGDNLEILRDYLIDECVDLVYLDPPFNSSRNYNVLFKDEQGLDSEAQIVAFEDTWHWGPERNMRIAA
jgi:16S rRNA G966 N2-methylase RsmD